MPKEKRKQSAEESEKGGLSPIPRRVFLRGAGIVVGAPIGSRKEPLEKEEYGR
jgi:hypothetical protein